jgi:hypothetical protein
MSKTVYFSVILFMNDKRFSQNALILEPFILFNDINPLR